MGLPTDLPEKVDSEALMTALEKDKKIQANVCHLVLLARIGQAVIHPIPVDDLRRSLPRI
jgi:3-dehydroquinate synthetase